MKVLLQVKRKVQQDAEYCLAIKKGMVEDKVVVDLKAKERLSEIDKPKLLTYLRFSELHLGLIINFHKTYLKNGIPIASSRNQT